MEDLDLVFDDSIYSLTEYVDEWKESIKEAAEETLSKKSEHKLAENKVSNRTRALLNRRDKSDASKK